MGAVDRRENSTDEKVFTDARSTTDVTDKPGNGSRNRLNNSGNPVRILLILTEKGERIDLTVGSGCAACALPVGVASAVGMQELNRAPQEYIAANAGENLGAWVQDSDTQISEWRCTEFEVQCHGQVAQTTGGGVQSGRCRQSDRAAARGPRWLVH